MGRLSDLFDGREQVPKHEIFALMEEIKSDMRLALANKNKNEWFDLYDEYYKAEYIVSDIMLYKKMLRLNKELNKHKSSHVEVTELNLEDRTVTIKLSQNIERDELTDIWNIIIKKMDIHKKNESRLVQKMILDWKLPPRMTYRQLAMKYYPNEVDIEASMDKVKKIVKRNAVKDWGTMPDVDEGDSFLK